MIIISKDESCITNFDNITNIFIGADKVTIKATSLNSGNQLARYNNPDITFLALKKLYECIGKADVFKFPQDKELEMELQIKESKWHHATGKKTKGHGKS